MKTAAIRRLLLILAVALVALQFFRPDRSNPSVVAQNTFDAHFAVPAGVRATLHRSCFDCHSSETHWPWYTNVSPVSWFVWNHVRSGQRHMNLDEWNRLKGAQQEATQFRQICRQMQRRSMPLSSYLWIHWKARVSDDEIKEVCGWASEMQTGLGYPQTTNK